MNHKLLILATSATTLLTTATANLVVIECTFPCLLSNDVCEVTNYYVKCKPNTPQTRWIITNTNSLLPEYQGTKAEINQSCQTAPQPKLKDASHLSTNTSETIVDWPPTSFDTYYSDCQNGLYCDRANICVKQLEHGQVCESNNQCLNGVCSQNTCQDNDNTSVTTANATAGESGGYTTVHIILTVVGIVLFLSLVCIGIFIFKRKKNKPAAQAAATTDKEQQLTNIPPVKTTSRSNSSSSSSSSSSLTTTTHHNVTNILDYESTFLSPSPSQQQQELQFQLLKIQQQTAPPPPPPPPYSP